MVPSKVVRRGHSPSESGGCAAPFLDAGDSLRSGTPCNLMALSVQKAVVSVGRMIPAREVHMPIHQRIPLFWVFLLAGCGTGLGYAERDLSPEEALAESRVQAEIREIDPRAGLIYVRTRTGEDGSVHYDSRTRIMYRGERYPALALGRGDLVELTMERTTENDYYASRIDLIQNAREGSTR